jgi:GTP pyrophosphokinase
MANASNKSENALFTDAWYGEPAESHAAGVLQILQTLNLDDATLTAASNIARTHGKDALSKLIGEEPAKLLIGYRGLRQAQGKLVRDDGGLSVAGQEEMLRKMLLAFGDDLRVVLIYLASRLQTLRWVAQEKMTMPAAWAQEILNIDASLANRLRLRTLDDEWRITHRGAELVYAHVHGRVVDSGQAIEVYTDARLCNGWVQRDFPPVLT